MDHPEDDSTPYTGRQRDLGRARGSLLAGVGVLVSGRPGSGRSRFIRELVGSLDDGCRSRLWVGHDLERLDDDAAERWTRAVAAREILPVASVGAAGPSRRIERLVRRGTLTQVDLGPLTARELTALATAHLGAPLHPSAVPEFVPARGGRQIAPFLRALSHSVSAGALTLDDGTWRPISPLPSMPALDAAVSTRAGHGVRAEHPDTGIVLDLLSLAPSLGLAVVTAVLEAVGLAEKDVLDVLEWLEGEEVIAIDEQGGSGAPSLRIHDGIDETTTALAVGAVRRRRLATALVDVLGHLAPTELTGAEALALGRFGLDLGEWIAPETLIRAARVSLGTAQANLSVRLAEAAVANGGGFDAAMTLAAAESQAGRPDDALDRLARSAQDASDDVQRMAALEAMARHVRESAVQSVELIDEVSLERLALSDLRRNMLRGFMLFNLGEVEAGRELIETALPDAEGLERAEGFFLVGTAHLFRGRLALAAEALDRAEAAYADVGADASNVHMVRANLNATRGRVDDSLPEVRALRDLVATFGQPVPQGMLGWAVGTLLLSAGRLREAQDELRATTVVLELAGVGRTLALVKLDLALASALAGDPEGARAWLPWEGPDDHGAGAGVSGKFLQVQGWIHASSGQREPARASLIRSADTHEAAGFLLPALAALAEAARMGAAAALVGRIERLAVGMDGEYVVVTLRLVRALAAGEAAVGEDEESLSLLADEFDGVGHDAQGIDLHIVAAEAFDRAAELHRRAGAARAAAASARRRDARIAACGVTSLPLVRPGQSALLSARELELAGLAASGLSNREIAERLVLSVRTVETHLQRVYRKLGVRGRDELTDEFTGPAESAR
ncbi:helix-turn-helix transcriptional regulator [Herbiconiux sp. YIM B11900]|uniref:helix-turn-helix transcriptional regulator n=1 Tax=Herbiconiux sp. YIM B11900 TaxID=3404131 RepID=UPI003F82B801